MIGFVVGKMFWLFFVFIVFCFVILCDFLGEICIVDKFNFLRCLCCLRCFILFFGDNVCGIDGIFYKSVCELNKIVCILGVRDIKIYSFGNCCLSELCKMYWDNWFLNVKY